MLHPLKSHDSIAVNVEYLKLMETAKCGDWVQVDTLLAKDFGLLAKKVPGQGLVLDQISGLLSTASSNVLETVIACCPRVWTRQESAIFARTLREASSTLANADPWKDPSLPQFDQASMTILAQVVMAKQISCIIWSHLGLGNDGVRNMMREL
eukprot:COSAG02_NODE_36319_length_456_cov_0.837535_1_plen_152_part_11